MEEPTLAGPSRPRRPANNNDDLASRIVALQRKNAATSSGVSTGTRGSRRAADGPASGGSLTVSSAPYTETDRAKRNQLAHALPSRPPSSPTAPRRTPQESNQRLKPSLDVDEYSRGSDRASSQRALYDPSRPAASRSPRQPEPQLEDRQRRRPDAQLRRQDGTGQVPGPARKLFDPSIHDPHHFSPRPTSDSDTGASRLLLRRAVNGRTPEEEADRERERRRRKEGSERGSAPSRRKDSDTRSKGSRSSEGSESFKDRERGKGKSDTGVKPILKEIHDGIKKLEQELIDMHRLMSQDPEAGISILLNGTVSTYSRKPRSSEDDAAAWVDLIAKHKQLAEMHDHFLVTLYDPLVPSSYHQLSVKYNIPSRLWQTAFHLILERLRHAWMSNQPAALDLLTDVVYDAYRFYSELLENQALANFRTAWIEALGDLARYRMAIASHVSETPVTQTATQVTIDDDNGEPPVSSGASIGAEVAQAWDVEDKETWRTTARDWYTMGITEKPGEGRLHHHLALLCRDLKGQEGRALYHYVKSLTVTHEFATSRESILPLFDSVLQSQRSLPEATAMDLFVRLHGMLFTRIQLDDFPTVMSRFMERLEEDASLDGVSRKATITQVDWMIMASVNLAALLQYGASAGVIRKALAQEGAERRRQHAAAADEDGDGDGDGPLASDANQGGEPILGVDFGDGSRATSPLPPPADMTTDEAPPITLTHATELAFAVFDFVLAHPNRIQGLHHVLNPYITIFLTFLATLFRQPHVGGILSAHVPWYRLRDFVNAANIDVAEEKRLATGAPLPEDWIVRGSEWVGRRVYERGFWKGKSSSRGSSGMVAQPRIGERFQSEMDVLLAKFDSAVDISEGVVDEVEGTDLTDGPVAVNQRRWKRVAWATGVLAKHVDGFNLNPHGKIEVEGSLDRMLKEGEARKEREREEEERRKDMERKKKWAEDEVEMLDRLEIESDDGEDDAELAALRERRRQLQSMLSGTAKVQRPKPKKRQALQVVPGYTMLIFDTNVLLDSLTMFSKLVEGGQWSVVVPLPVVTELDGLSKEPAPLGANAKAAVTYLESRIRTHSLCLKIQTSKGNYLSDLLIRTEHHLTADSTAIGAEATARSMDDRILNIASFQQEHFVDRSTLLGMPNAAPGSTKVLLVSNDRNLRLKARARGVDCADEKELNGVIARA